jgi:hypothetical protein
MTFPQRGEPDDSFRVVLARQADRIELFEPTFLKPDQALAVLVGLWLAGDGSERERPLNGLVAAAVICGSRHLLAHLSAKKSTIQAAAVATDTS